MNSNLRTMNVRFTTSGPLTRRAVMRRFLREARERGIAANVARIPGTRRFAEGEATGSAERIREAMHAAVDHVNGRWWTGIPYEVK
jgi:hypothetical protein